MPQFIEENKESKKIIKKRNLLPRKSIVDIKLSHSKNFSNKKKLN